MTAQEAVDTTLKTSRQRIARLAKELREKFPDVPRPRAPRDFSKITQHPSAGMLAFRENVSRLADQIQDEDRARLLEPTGPKILRGRPPIRRPQTAIISHAAQAAYERRMAREKLSSARASLATRRRA